MQYGESVPSTIDRMADELVAYGFICHRVTDDGKIRGHSITEMWIDEAPDVGAVEFTKPTRYWIDEALNIGTIGQMPEPRLSFLAKCMRQHFGIELDLTINTASR